MHQYLMHGTFTSIRILPRTSRAKERQQWQSTTAENLKLGSNNAQLKQTMNDLYPENTPKSKAKLYPQTATKPLT
ncbi:Hypothetical protein PHPALM_13988 [Phytophthora palmivora]|uniref:Uncharacterized protein n=1 Tax=Phytophthora palmivora TaxID=4796 RepID=A0A2P4XVX6_9STRA|nr:Hypothetical protein PHPALM_13988 [Phytophthora palmivora]